jgi:hypothetical protein
LWTCLYFSTFVLGYSDEWIREADDRVRMKHRKLSDETDVKMDDGKTIEVLANSQQIIIFLNNLEILLIYFNIF